MMLFPEAGTKGWELAIGVIFGLYWDNGKENGNYYNGLYRSYMGLILGLYWDNGKENGNNYSGFRV